MSNRRIVLGCVGLGLLALSGACFTLEPPRPDPQPPRFEDVSSEAGVAYRGLTFALSAAEIGNEGFPDLFLTNHHQVVWMKNKGGTFAEPVFLSGDVDFDVHGMSWLDFDLDARPDLLVTVGANRGFGRGDNRVFLYRGKGDFEDSDDLGEAMRDPLGRGRCSVVRDFDGDGWTDIALMNAVQRGRMHRFFQGGPAGFKEITDATNIAHINASCLETVHFEPEDQPYFVAYGPGEDSGHVFGFRDGRFADVSEAMGIAWRGTAQAVVPGDYDNDGDIDLYLIRGHGNQTDVKATGPKSLMFRLLARERGQKVGLKFRGGGTAEINLYIAGPGRAEIIHIGRDGQSPSGIPFDIDLASLTPGFPGPDSGDFGIFVWKDGEEYIHVDLCGDGSQLQFVGGEIAGTSSIEGVELTGASPESRGQPNALFNYDQGRFFNSTDAAGVQDLSSGRDGTFFDADNDGDLDLFLINSGGRIGNIPDRFFLNLGDGTFSDFTETAGIRGPLDGRGQSVVACDIDRNGSLELYTANGDGPWPGNDGPVVIWHNSSPVGNWAALDLRGCGRDFIATGTRVVVNGINGRLALQCDATTSRFTTSILPLHIGMGSADRVEVDVYWRAGSTERITLEAGEIRRLAAPWCREPVG